MRLLVTGSLQLHCEEEVTRESISDHLCKQARRLRVPICGIAHSTPHMHEGSQCQLISSSEYLL